MSGLGIDPCSLRRVALTDTTASNRSLFFFSQSSISSLLDLPSRYGVLPMTVAFTPQAFSSHRSSARLLPRRHVLVTTTNAPVLATMRFRAATHSGCASMLSYLHDSALIRTPSKSRNRSRTCFFSIMLQFSRSLEWILLQAQPAPTTFRRLRCSSHRGSPINECNDSITMSAPRPE
jgi:hypothetical protein